jgi:hypothetical protein
MPTGEQSLDPESDPRFPSGRWGGFFVQRHPPAGKYGMELLLTFAHGTMRGEGRDRFGKFVVRGRYDVADGKCRWTKRYLGKHDVFYSGFNEGKGIWGQWEIPTGIPGFTARGGFHIWPDGMGVGDDEHLDAEADLPAPVEELALQEK